MLGMSLMHHWKSCILDQGSLIPNFDSSYISYINLIWATLFYNFEVVWSVGLFKKLIKVQLEIQCKKLNVGYYLIWAIAEFLQQSEGDLQGGIRGPQVSGFARGSHGDCSNQLLFSAGLQQSAAVFC